MLPVIKSVFCLYHLAGGWRVSLHWKIFFSHPSTSCTSEATYPPRVYLTHTFCALCTPAQHRYTPSTLHTSHITSNRVVPAPHPHHTSHITHGQYHHLSHTQCSRNLDFRHPSGTASLTAMRVPFHPPPPHEYPWHIQPGQSAHPSNPPCRLPTG